MRRHRFAFLRLLAASLALPVSVAFAAPSLLLPHTGPIAKSETLRPFKSEGQRVQLNLEALEAMKPGDEVEFRLPGGAVHTFVFDLLKDEGNGVVSWIGLHKGSQEKLRAIVTNGPAGSFGRISTPEGDFALVPAEGFDWLIDMAAEKPHLPPIDLREDVRIPPVPKRTFPQLHQPEYQSTVPGVNSVAVSKATPPQVVVDLMVVHTQTFAANLGATLQTRLNFLVASANTMYADSEVGIVLRLVHSVAVDYPDSGVDNGDALDAITPSGGGGTGVFANVESLRTQYGADVVAFLRNGSDFGGSGMAWIANAPMSPGFAPFLYSVTTGCVRGCEWIFIHELGHNMGNNHDRATSAWQAGGVANPPPGSYPYSFGFYSCNANALNCNPNVAGGCASQPECASPRGGTNNFADIMAYFHATATRNFKFSNPAVTCAGSLGLQQACGVVEGQPDAANAALSMNNNRAALSAIRATAAAPADPARLFGISTRMQVRTGNDVMIGGFIVGGSSSKTVVVRARGPSLAASGITNALANPMLQLVRASDNTTIATNDDWALAGNAAALTASGFAPSNALESAVFVTLAPGGYTAIVSGVGGTTGVGIIEVYEVDLPQAPLAGISTRGQVLTGNDVMIGGFVVQGSGPQTLVVRARGPSLTASGITNALADPTLQLVRASDNTTIAINDNWASAANAAALTSSGFAPSNALESAVLITLSPGAYTAIVSGAGGGTGVGIVEVYAVP